MGQNHDSYDIKLMALLSFGVIGCGMLARSMHLPHLLETPEARLHVCCDLNEESLAICRRDFGPVQIERDFNKVVNDPQVDALIIATGERYRLPIYAAAAAAKKPIYTEKPLAASWEDTMQAREMVEQSGIPFCVGHNRRCSPAMMRAISHFHRHMKDSYSAPWRFKRAGWEKIDTKGQNGVPGLSIRINDDWQSWKSIHITGSYTDYGLLIGEMTHFVDLARLFLQSEATRVFTMHNGILNHVVSIEFANQALASIAMFSNGSFGYPKELLEVMGGSGVVVCDHMLEVRTAGMADAPALETFPFLKDRHPHIGTEGGVCGWLKKKRAACDEAAVSGNPLDQFTAEPDKGHARMLKEFIREIRGERSPVSPIQDAVEAMRICLAAVKSAQEKRPVEVAEIG